MILMAILAVALPLCADEQGVAELRAKSEAGDLKATIELAHLSLVSAQGVEYDSDFIFETFQKGAAAGNSRAQYGLAKCYVIGVGTERDEKVALQHARASADQNDPQGIRYLGNCYLYGRGMDEPDPEKGIKLLKKAIKLGNEMAEYTYAFYLTRNLKDRASNEEGLRIARSLVERKHPEGAHLMGTLYHDGMAGLPNDRKLAMKHYRIAADQNHAGGLHQVGNMLLQDKKPDEAIGWLVKAINRGSRESGWALAQILKDDPDLQSEPDQWVGYATESADRGNKWAQDAVAGFYYMDAPDKKKDWVKAARYAGLAAAQGRCHCWDWLSSMHIHGKHGLKKNVKLALQYCEKHFEHHHYSAENAGHILLLEEPYRSKRALRIKGYAALLSARKRGAELPDGKLSDLAKGAGMDAAEIKEATALSKSGFPKPGDTMSE